MPATTLEDIALSSVDLDELRAQVSGLKVLLGLDLTDNGQKLHSHWYERHLRFCKRTMPRRMTDELAEYEKLQNAYLHALLYAEQEASCGQVK